MLLRVTRVTTGTLIKDWKRMKYPIHFGLEKAGLPLILTIENPKNLCFLIDTGYWRFPDLTIYQKENQMRSRMK